MESPRPQSTAAAQRDLYQRRGLSRRQTREGQHMSTDLIVTEAAAKKLAGFRKLLKDSGGWPMLTKGKNPEPVKDSQANVLKAIDVLELECSYDIFKNSYIVHGFELGAGLIGDLSDKMI